MDLDAYFDEHPSSECPSSTSEGFRSGFVTLVGRPNSGKSTLINTIMGKKIAITSDTAQTTRHRFRAVFTCDEFQMIIVDTPGLHKPHDILGEELNTSAIKALNDVDVIALLIDSTKPVGRGDEWVIDQISHCDSKKICVLSKCDLATPKQIESQRLSAKNLLAWDSILSLSAKTGENVETFIKTAADYLPIGPAWFPRDMQTDQPIEVMVAEFIREKILRNFYEEVPHAIGVSVDEMRATGKKKNKIMHIEATIYVEHDSQKGMIIGKKGNSIKKIGSEARIDLEHLLGMRVYLELKVKVKKNWRRNAAQVRRFGYGEGL